MTQSVSKSTGQSNQSIIKSFIQSQSMKAVILIIIKAMNATTVYSFHC